MGILDSIKNMMSGTKVNAGNQDKKADMQKEHDCECSCGAECGCGEHCACDHTQEGEKREGCCSDEESCSCCGEHNHEETPVQQPSKE